MNRAELAELPKVILHDHLDGGLRPETIIDLAHEFSYEGLPTTDLSGLAAWFHQDGSGSLERYLEAFQHTFGVMQTASAIERVAYEAVEDLAAEGVVYAEIRFAPHLHTRRGLTPGAVLDAALDGFKQGAADFGVKVGTIVVALRQEADSMGPAANAADHHQAGVVAFDLAGPEAGFSAENHAQAFRMAAAAGLAVTIHGGEGDGPDSIAAALRCGAQRIGHGVRIIEDTETRDGEIVAMGPTATSVFGSGIPLEVCMQSNLDIGLFPDAASHSMGALYRAGFVVTLNTDNRLMSQTSPVHEFSLAVDNHGFGPSDLMAVTENAIRAGFGPEEDRQRILRDVIRPAYEALV